MRFRLLIYTSLLLAFFSSLGGNRDFTVKDYGIDQDIEGIFIYSLVQDEDGFLWISTEKGLYRFDGQSMINLNQRDSTMGVKVTASMVAKDGHLYMGYYEGGLGVVEHGRYRIILSAEELPSKINRIYQDTEGTIWVLTQNKGIYKIKNGISEKIVAEELKQLISYDMIRHENSLYVATNEGLLKLKINPDEGTSSMGYVEGSFNVTVNALYEDPHDANILWIGTDDGLFYVEYGENENLITLNGLEPIKIISLARDQFKKLWVGTANAGLIEIELKNNQPLKTSYFNKNNGFPSNQINSLHVDRENEIWVGTFGDGLVQLNRTYFHHYELFKSKRIHGINDIFHVNDDLYYYGTDNGLVKAYNKKGTDSLMFEIITETKNFKITRTLLLGNKAWLGTKNNGLINYDLNTGKIERMVLDRGEGTLTNLVRYLVQGNDGSLWVSIAGNGVFNMRTDGSIIKHFNTRNGFYHNEIFAILPDNAGNIWFGAQSVGLALLRNGETEPTYLTKDEIFPARDINSITQDDAGKVWIATAGEGLFGYDGEEFQAYTVQNGLLSNHCNAVEIDNAGQIWVGHRKGLSLIQPKYDIIRRFSHPDELGETESVISSVDKDDHGNIWFGNPYGITKVVLPHLQHQVIERITQVKDIRLFFDQVDLLQYSAKEKLDNLLPTDLMFAHNENQLSFDYVSINLKNPDAVYYKYRLEGYDDEWSPITKSTVATFTNLDPGKYSFQIKESDHKDLWNDDYQSISLTIDSPYWEKWWFYLIQLLVMLSLFIATYFLSTKIKNHFVIRLMVYVSLFVVFEYIHTEFEPYIESIAGETPIFQVGINLILALVLLPIEMRLSSYLSHKEATKIKVAEAMKKN